MANKGRRLVGAIIVLIGAILLIAAVFIPWYTYQAKESSPIGSGTTTINSYPGFTNENGTIQCSTSGSAVCPFSQTSYQTYHYNNTGNLAETGFFLLIVGFILGFIGAIFGVMSRGNARRAGPALAFGIIAMLLALITPVLFMALLPGAQSNDIPSAARTTSSGPWSSFFGSTSFSPITGVTVSLTWGAGTGWYLSFVAFVILLIGVIMLFLYRKDPAEPAPVAAPAPTGTSTTTPPSS